MLLLGRWLTALPDREELGPRIGSIRFDPVTLPRDGFAPFRLAGAWEVTSDDPRFGGISALAIDGNSLVALTDSGAVVRFAGPSRQSGRAVIRELPGGPGVPHYKSHRDSEALVRDPLGRGWWVAFENRNELWLYDLHLSRPLARVALGKRWSRNFGIEALASSGEKLLLFPERGDSVVELAGASARTLPLGGRAGPIADAARLSSGELLVLNRRLTPSGFANSIAALERSLQGYRYGWRVSLGVSRLDNVEALAPERLPDGRTRLWLMTDDNFQRPLQTLLIALDLTASRAGVSPRSPRTA